MPLIILTGLPCSGKTHRAQQIASSLNTFISSSPDPAISKRTVQIVLSHHASADPETGRTPTENTPSSIAQDKSLRNEIYTSASLEKTARAAEFSAIKRAVSKDNIVITDSLNYIKGYRYQLWCEAKAAGTRCCVVHVAAREDECRGWNSQRLKAWGEEEVVVDQGDENFEKDARKSRKGENILGDLLPESHTAIYGDRISEEQGTTNTRSRSSSTDGLNGEDISRPQHTDDTVTLKSLYITDRNQPDISSSSTRPNPSSSTSDPLSSSLPTSTTTIPIPEATSSPPYMASTLTSLIMRYEPPSPFSRWDTPLFTIPSTDNSPPVQEIWFAIYPPPSKPTSKKALSQLSARDRELHERGSATGNGSVNGSTTTRTNNSNREKGITNQVKPHAATVLPRATSSDALQVLESTTMEVVKQILSASRLHSQTGPIPLSISLNINDTSFETSISIPSNITLFQPMLQRLRRKYTQIQRGGIAHGVGYVSGKREIVEGFIQFLEQEWMDDE